MLLSRTYYKRTQFQFEIKFTDFCCTYNNCTTRNPLFVTNHIYRMFTREVRDLYTACNSSSGYIL